MGSSSKALKGVFGVARVVAAIAVVGVFLGIVVTMPAEAQFSGATLSGIVQDKSGAAVANAKISITNTENGEVRETASNGAGVYSAPNLAPGVYEIKVAAGGFATLLQKELTLTVGAQQTLNLTLEVGEVSQTVEVAAQPPSVETTSSTVGEVVGRTTVEDLPLNGRDWTSLALLQPGVAQVTQPALGVSNDRPNRGLGVEISIGGNRPQQNNYRLDGVSINDQASGAPGSILGSVLGVDAVQEFSVVTSNASADYGKTSGGVINAISRSGANSFHGTGFEFARNAVFDARNYFDAQNGIPAFKRNQFGGSAGGKIIKDRTFFFGDYEGVRQNLGKANSDTVPSHSAAQVAYATANHPEILPYLALYPSPDPATIVGTDPYSTGTFQFAAPQVSKEDFFTTHIDHELSAANTLSGTYLFDKGQTTTPDSFDFKNIGTISRRQTVALEELHIFSPAVLNTARLGFNRTVSIAPTTLSAINKAASDTSLGFVLDSSGTPIRPVGLINVGGLSNFPGGLGAVGEYDFHYNSFQGYDDLNWTRNKHSLKFGVYGERIQSNQLTHGVNPNGQYGFASLSDFLNNIPTNFNSYKPGAISPRDLRQSIFGAYVQDDYRIRPNLTLNLGVRYEMATVPTETANRLTTLVDLKNDTAPKLGSPYFSNPTLRDFSPRVGFAWDPFGTSRTSIRGAFGIYDVLPLPYQFELLTLLAAPFAQAGSYSFPSGSSGGFPFGGYSNLQPKTLRYTYVEQHPHRNYVEQWSFSMQRELLAHFTVTAGYIGSHGVHQPFHADDINQVLPTLTAAGWAWPADKSGLRYNPNVGMISASIWSASSNYHGLTLQATKRMSHGFQVQGSYAFSKTIDTGSSGIAGDTFANSISSLPWFDPKLRRGLSDFDVRQVLSINGLWMIPSAKSWSGPAEWVASGWQLGGIYSLTSGLPFTPTISGDPLGLNSSDNYAFPNRVRGCNPVAKNYKQSGLLYLDPKCFSFPASNLPSNTTVPRLLGNSGRNSVIGPGVRSFDFSLFKNNPIRRISETFNVQFRGEIFNLFNRTNFNPPVDNNAVFDDTGALLLNAGKLSSTATTSRQMQLAVKVIW